VNFAVFSSTVILQIGSIAIMFHLRFFLALPEVYTF
jgi:hypothetical protein